jgi:hypothetical protein
MNTNHTAEFRADIGLRLLVEAGSYAKVGALMDAISLAITEQLVAQGARATFDFTHFNTHPCKSAEMAQLAGGYAGDGPADYAPPLRQY